MRPEVAGADDQRVARLDRDALGRERRLELGDRDVVVGGERIDAEVAGHVGQHAAGEHAVAQDRDVVGGGALRADHLARPAVVHVVVVEAVGERVPLRRGLQRHHDHVVGEAVAGEPERRLPAGADVGAGRDHRRAAG